MEKTYPFKNIIMSDLKYTLKFMLDVIKEYGLDKVYDDENNLKETVQEQLDNLK